jgi:hypothetical protein
MRVERFIKQKNPGLINKGKVIFRDGFPEAGKYPFQYTPFVRE